MRTCKQILTIILTLSLCSQIINNIDKNNNTENLKRNIGKLIKLDPEFQTGHENSYIFNYSSVMAQTDGYIVVFQNYATSLSSSTKIYVRKYDNLGVLQNLQFTIENGYYRPSLAIFSNNQFLVFFDNDEQIKGIKFSSLGIKIQDITVSSHNLLTTKNSSGVCILLSEGFVVVFNKYNFFTSYNIYGIIFNNSGTIIVGEFKINSSIADSSSTPQVSCLMKGRFVVTWVGFDNKIYAQIYEANGSAVNSNFVVNETTMLCQNQQVSGLKDGNILITWEGKTSTNFNIYQKIYNNSGKKIFANTIINSDLVNDNLSPSVSVFTDGYIITWIGGSNKKIFSKKFKNDGTATENELLINSGLIYNKSHARNAYLSNYSNVVVWSEDTVNGIYANIVTNTIPTLRPRFMTDLSVSVQTPIADAEVDVGAICNNFSINVSAGVAQVINFTQILNLDIPVYLKIKIKSLPVNINASLKNLDTGLTINYADSSLYNPDKIEYKGMSPDSFTYVIVDILNSESAICSVTINNCFSTCEVCTAVGTVSNHNCIICKTGYYKKSDALSNCYNTTPNNYFFNSATQMYEACYLSCKTCNGSGDSNNNNCITCNTDNYYYPEIGIPALCYNTPPDGFYLNINNKQYENCYTTCKTCSNLGNSNSQSCTTCVDNYSPKSELPSNCYLDTSTFDFYYFSSATNEFRACYQTCKTCNTNMDGTDSIHNCIVCKDEFIPKSDVPLNCYPNNFTPLNYYINNSVFSPCTRINNNSISYDTSTKLNVLNFIQNDIIENTSFTLKINLSHNLNDESLLRQIDYVYMISILDSNQQDLVIDNFRCNEINVSSIDGEAAGEYNLFLVDYSGNLIMADENVIINLTNINDDSGATSKNDTDNSNTGNTDKGSTNTSNSNNATTTTTNSTTTNTETNTTTSNSNNSENTNSSTIQEAISNIIKSDNNTSGYMTDTIIIKNDTVIIQIASTADISKNKELFPTINTLVFLNFEECEKILKTYYNITKDENLIYSKIDFINNNTIISNHNDNSIQSDLSIFDHHGNILNLSLCKNSKITFGFWTHLNITNAKYFGDLGFDIYNPQDKFYNDICVPYSQNRTDLTLNNRREEIFPNITMKCSAGCIYTGIDFNTSSVKCECIGSPQYLSLNYFEMALEDLPQNHFLVITCFFKILGSGNLTINYGFIFILFFFLISIFISLIVACICKKSKKEKLKEIIKFDGNFLEVEKDMIVDEKSHIKSDLNINNKNIEMGVQNILDKVEKINVSNINNSNNLNEENMDNFYNNFNYDYLNNNENGDVMLAADIVVGPKINFDNINNNIYNLPANPHKNKYKVTLQNKGSEELQIDDNFNDESLGTEIEENKIFDLEEENSENNENKDNNKLKIKIYKNGQRENSSDDKGLIKSTYENVSSSMQLNNYITNFDSDDENVLKKRNLLENKKSLSKFNSDKVINYYNQFNDFKYKIEINSPNGNNEFDSPDMENVDKYGNLNIENKRLKKNHLRTDSASTKLENENLIIKRRNSNIFHKGKSLILKEFEENSFSLENEKPRNNSIELKDLENTHPYIKNLKDNFFFTIRDYPKMNFNQILEFDQRGFWLVYWDYLIVVHDIVSVIFKTSLIMPLSIRIFNFFFGISLDFTFNAIFYSNVYISDRHTNPEDKDFLYTFIYELPKSLWAALFAAFITVVLKKLIDPTLKIELKFNKSLMTMNINEVNMAYEVYQKEMRCSYIIYFTLVFLIQIFLFVFATCFCGVYLLSQISWIQGGVISVIIRLMGLQIIIPLLQTAMRSVAICLKSRCLYEMNFVAKFLDFIV